LGNIYREQGKKSQAITYYEKLIELWKNGDEDLWPLQEARKQLKKLKEATALSSSDGYTASQT
jgi:tetratricopeptide (TPR) repeat protein